MVVWSGLSFPFSIGTITVVVRVAHGCAKVVPTHLNWVMRIRDISLCANGADPSMGNLSHTHFGGILPHLDGDSRFSFFTNRSPPVPYSKTPQGVWGILLEVVMGVQSTLSNRERF